MTEENINHIGDQELDLVSGGAQQARGFVKVINCDAVNLRDTGNVKKILTVIPCGTKLPYFGRYHQWGKVSYKGIIGYIYQDYFKEL